MEGHSDLDWSTIVAHNERFHVFVVFLEAYDLGVEKVALVLITSKNRWFLCVPIRIKVFKLMLVHSLLDIRQVVLLFLLVRVVGVGGVLQLGEHAREGYT